MKRREELVFPGILYKLMTYVCFIVFMPGFKLESSRLNYFGGIGVVPDPQNKSLLEGSLQEWF